MEMSGRLLLSGLGLRRLSRVTEACLANSNDQYVIANNLVPACTAYRTGLSQIAGSAETDRASRAGNFPAGKPDVDIMVIATCRPANLTVTRGSLNQSSQRQAPQARCFSAAAPAQEQDSSTAEQLNPLMQTPAPAADDSTVGRQASPGQMAQAVQKGMHISPKKLNDFVSVVRRLPVGEAMLQCKVSPTKAARLTFKTIQSAQANAINNHHMDATRLFIDLAHVGKGTHLRRNRIHGRGRSGVMHRYYSHLTIVLKEGDKKPKTRIQQPLLERPRKHWPQSWPAAAAAASF